MNTEGEPSSEGGGGISAFSEEILRFGLQNTGSHEFSQQIRGILQKVSSRRQTRLKVNPKYVVFRYNIPGTPRGASPIQQRTITTILVYYSVPEGIHSRDDPEKKKVHLDISTAAAIVPPKNR